MLLTRSAGLTTHNSLHFIAAIYFFLFSLPTFSPKHGENGAGWRRKCAVSVLLGFELKMLFSKDNTMWCVFRSCCWEWCFGGVRRRGSVLCCFSLLYLYPLALVVWSAQQIRRRLPQSEYLWFWLFGLQRNGDGSCFWELHCYPLRIQVTKLRNGVWLRAFCWFLVGCYCELNL